LLAAVADCLAARTEPPHSRRQIVMSLPAAETKMPSGVLEKRPARWRRYGDLFAKMTLATRLAAAMTLLVAIAVSRSDGSTTAAGTGAVAARARSHRSPCAADATELESHAAGARRDVASYRSSRICRLDRARLAAGVDPQDRVPVNVWRERIAMHFSAELKPSPPMR